VIVRKSTHEREIARLRAEHGAELALTREEHDRQRQALIRDLKDEFGPEIEARVRAETAREHRHAMRREKTLRNLISYTRQLLRLDYHDPTAPALPPEQAEQQIKTSLRVFEQEEAGQ
jgi:hypothetical protein